MSTPDATNLTVIRTGFLRTDSDGKTHRMSYVCYAIRQNHEDGTRKLVIGIPNTTMETAMSVESDDSVRKWAFSEIGTMTTSDTASRLVFHMECRNSDRTVLYLEAADWYPFVRTIAPNLSEDSRNAMFQIFDRLIETLVRTRKHYSGIPTSEFQKTLFIIRDLRNVVLVRKADQKVFIEKLVLARVHYNNYRSRKMIPDRQLKDMISEMILDGIRIGILNLSWRIFHTDKSGSKISEVSIKVCFDTAFYKSEIDLRPYNMRDGVVYWDFQDACYWDVLDEYVSDRNISFPVDVSESEPSDRANLPNIAVGVTDDMFNTLKQYMSSPDYPGKTAQDAQFVLRKAARSCNARTPVWQKKAGTGKNRRRVHE